MPDTICAAIRQTSPCTFSLPTNGNGQIAVINDNCVNIAEPSATSMCVRNPAERPCKSRSQPIAIPHAAAMSNLLNISLYNPQSCNPYIARKSFIPLFFEYDC